jgi:hypothetical protein
MPDTFPALFFPSHVFAVESGHKARLAEMGVLGGETVGEVSGKVELAGQYSPVPELYTSA